MHSGYAIVDKLYVLNNKLPPAIVHAIIIMCKGIISVYPNLYYCYCTVTMSTVHVKHKKTIVIYQGHNNLCKTMYIMLYMHIIHYACLLCVGVTCHTVH